MFGLSLSGFSTPWWFLLLIVVAVAVAGYLIAQRRRRRHTMRFTNLELLERVAPKRQGWSRHVPAALLGVTLVLLTVALAGPTAEQKVPRNRATVMLTIDVSLSMRATDIEPSRLEAAKASAKRFADGLTPGVNLGVVAFAGTSTVLVMPTTDRVAAKRAIDGLKLSQATATGDGINAAMSSIDSFGKMVGGAEGPPPARIVLMTDGKETIPNDPESPRGAFTKADEAKKRNIPISTISFGTAYGQIQMDGQSLPVAVDDESMKEIAQRSGGEFYKAASAEQLTKVYDTLGEQIGYEIKHDDASKPWLVLGTLAALAAATCSIYFGGRLP